MLDFQALYSAILGLQRLADGRYPERLPSDAFALPLAEYIRHSAIRVAVEHEVDVIATNSDGDPDRRQRLLGLLGPGATERVVDPGRAVVEARLSVDGRLSSQCAEAIGRWYR